MWCEGCHVESLWEGDCCVEFLTAHGRVIEALQVDHKNLGEPIDSQVLLNVYFTFAAAALEACADHALWLHKLVQAIAQLDTAKETHGAPRNFNRQIHEVVKGTVLEATAQAGGAIDKLAFE